MDETPITVNFPPKKDFNATIYNEGVKMNAFADSFCELVPQSAVAFIPSKDEINPYFHILTVSSYWNFMGPLIDILKLRKICAEFQANNEVDINNAFVSLIVGPQLTKLGFILPPAQPNPYNMSEELLREFLIKPHLRTYKNGNKAQSGILTLNGTDTEMDYFFYKYHLSPDALVKLLLISDFSADYKMPQ